MITKLPAFYDGSHWLTVKDWTKVSPKPLLCGWKATEGVTYKDDTFPGAWLGMKSVGIYRLAYHFHRKASLPKDQANYFINYIRQFSVTSKDILCLDVEEGGESAAQLQTWLMTVQEAFPFNQVWIYSRQNLLDPIVFIMGILGIKQEHPLNKIAMTQAQRDFFRSIPVWVAGYPTNPDLYNSIPSGYIPDQTKWGKPIAWQYAENGVIAGMEGKTDLNMMTSELITSLPPIVVTPPPPLVTDVVTIPHDGITRISGKRNGWQVELFKFDRTKVRFEVVYCDPPETVSSVVKRKNATGGFNAGDYNRFTYDIQDYTVSNGDLIKTREIGGGRPSFMVLADNSIVIDTKNATNVQQAFTGIRPLVQLGTIDARLFDTTQTQNTEGHARFVFGLDASGNPLLMASEGIHPSLLVYDGLKLSEAARFVQSYGAVTAGDGGGGGDVTCILDGQPLIVPENETDGVHFERPLPVVIVYYAEDGDTNMNGTAKENLGKIPTERNSPTVATGNDVGRLEPGVTVEFTEIVHDVDPSINRYWLHLANGNYVNYSDITHTGVTAYFKILTQPSAEPPPDTEPSETTVTIVLNEVTKTIAAHVTWSDGTITDK